MSEPEVKLVKLFDTAKPFNVEIQSGGIRKCSLKYPSDAQWIERTKSQRIIQTDLGRGKSRNSTTPIERFDEELFKKLLTEQPVDEFDEYEASLAIDRLAKCEIIDAEDIGNNEVKISAEVFGGAIIHVVFKHPRRRLVAEYSDAVAKKTHNRTGAEIRVFLEPADPFFKAVFVSAGGYAEGSAIPIVHKDTLVTELARIQNPEAQSPAT
jgi:galactokinase